MYKTKNANINCNYNFNVCTTWCIFNTTFNLKIRLKTIICMRLRCGVMGDQKSNEYYHRDIYD